MAKWQTVFTSDINYKIEIVKDILENHGLNPVIVNKKEFYAQTGVYELQVISDEVITALKIIEDDVRIR